MAVKGKLEFQVLYRKEGGGLQTLGGSIPFEDHQRAGSGGKGLRRVKLDAGGLETRR